MLKEQLKERVQLEAEKLMRDNDKLLQEKDELLKEKEAEIAKLMEQLKEHETKH